MSIERMFKKSNRSNTREAKEFLTTLERDDFLWVTRGKNKIIIGAIGVKTLKK